MSETYGLMVLSRMSRGNRPGVIDYVFLPKKKSRLFLKADPVKVTGPLHNPSIVLIPWKSAVTTYGTLFFAPYVFVGVAAADYLSGMLKIGSTA